MTTFRTKLRQIYVRLVLVQGEMQTEYIEERNRNTSTLYEGIKRTTISHFMPLTQKKSTTYDVGNLGLCLGQTQQLTRQMPLVVYVLLTFPELLSSTPVFSGVRVSRSLVLYEYFVDRCLSFGSFSFGRCVVCSSITDSDYPFGFFKLFLLWD